MTALQNSKPEEAILDYIKVSITDLRVAYPNIPFTPVVGTGFYRVHFMPIPSVRLGFGKADRHSAILQIDANCPIKNGMLEAVEMARTIETLFDRLELITDDGVKVRFIDAPYSNNHFEDADWYKIPVSMTYTIIN
jgi:hypothetical protein